MAKEAIYTIPLWDAIKSGHECPFCFIEGNLEKDLIHFCLSDAYMEVDFRKTTNEIGFCRHHNSMLYASNNKLGLVLITQSHTMEMLNSFDAILKKNHRQKRTLLSKPSNAHTDIESLNQTIKHDCYICRRIDDTMDRYYATFFHLFNHDASFIEQFKLTKGFCMTHYLSLIALGQKTLSQKHYDSFIEITEPVFTTNMQRVLGDMQWFVNKYDYRYEKEPWKEAKDAPKRCIQKINGTLVD